MPKKYWSVAETKIFSTYLIKPTIMAMMLSTIRIQCAPSAKCIASLPKSLWCTNTKNRMRDIREPTNISKPKKSPFEAPTQSTRPCCACASAIALRDNTISRRCSRSSCVTYLKNRFYHHCFTENIIRTKQSRVGSAFWVVAINTTFILFPKLH